MRKPFLITAVVLSAFLFCGFSLKDLISLIIPGSGAHAQSPESIFNEANEAMARGDDARAIELYYLIIEKHPGFSTYRADVLYRLGSLLYKTERYEEAERIFHNLINGYENYPKIKIVYEKLMRIYVHEFRNEGKARGIRDAYAKKFGKTGSLARIDRTMVILNEQNFSHSGMMALEPKDITIKKSIATDAFDPEFFPVRHYIKKRAKSPDNRYLVERRKTKRKYYLYLKDLKTKKERRINDSKNGYAPQWSWDSRYVAFTSMDWLKMERKIKIYDVSGKRTKLIFKAGRIGPVLCFSPDSSKILFWYRDNPWAANMNGQVSLLSPRVREKEIRMVAWSKDGSRVLTGKKGTGKKYHVYRLARREIEIVK